jgi:probable HAF family extracellular repeat protein
MKNCKLMSCVFGFVLMFTVQMATAADEPPLAFKFTTVNVPGATQTFPGGINNAGVVVGGYEDSSQVFHGYILSGKKLTKLDDPKGIGTLCSNLAPDGAIAVVGYYIASDGTSVGFLYKNGIFTDISGPQGTTASAAFGINDSGAIVGDYTDANGNTHGFLLNGTKYTTLNVPGALSTVAYGINNTGNIVVSWEDSQGDYKSSLYNGKTYKTIDVPGAIQSIAQGINSVGDVVYEWANSGFHGALLQTGKYYKFNYPGAQVTNGSGINDKSTIVGWFEVTNGGPASGFKATFK